MATHPPTPADAPDAPPPLPAPYSGGRFPRLIVVLCFVITAVATALIYWRWANVTEPSSYVIVQGQEEHNGTVVVIRSDTVPETVATLSPQNHYAVTIFLHPGSYTLTATQNGETLIHGSLFVAHRRWKTIVLRPRRSLPGDTPQRTGVSS